MTGKRVEYDAFLKSAIERLTVSMLQFIDVDRGR